MCLLFVHSSITSSTSIYDLEPTQGNQKVGTTVFAHADSPQHVAYTSTFGEDYTHGGSTDVPLGDFLKRPVEIHSGVWTIGTDYFTDFNPWEAFLTNVAVAEKLKYFRYVRGHLRIRAIITGNPTLQGRLILTYRPRHAEDQYPVPGAFSSANLTWMTTTPHFFLDPMKGEGGEMTLPFFCPENWIDLSATNSIQAMGQIFIRSPFQMYSGTSTAGRASITVYAWMEDAEICTPTSTPIRNAYVLQSDAPTAAVGFLAGVTATSVVAFLSRLSWHSNCDVDPDEGDDHEVPQSSEFAESPISKTAGAIAKGAGLLTSIPPIAPYAMATEKVFSTASRIASLFGFSRPAVIENPSRYREQWLGDLASTNTHELVSRIGVDVKGQLTVDPRTVGLDGTDEMAITNIVTKETIFSEFDWGTAIAKDALLWNAGVHPAHYTGDSSTPTNSNMYPPPCAVSQLFKYWRGTIVYKFMIVGNAFNRGKLKVTYDPLGVAPASDTNLTYSRIIDLETTRSFEIPITWNAPVPYLQVTEATFGLDDPTVGTVAVVPDPNFMNGRISVYVQERLTCPDELIYSQVKILASYRMEPDAQFAQPIMRFHRQRLTFSPSGVGEVPQSAEVPQSGEHLTTASGMPQDNMPVGAEPMDSMGDSPIVTSTALNKVFMGETVDSLRLLMKRYNHHSAVGNDVVNTIGPQRLISGGYGMSVHEYIRSMYAGWRGSLRFKVSAWQNGADDDIIHVAPIYGDTSIARPDGATPNGLFANRGAVEFELPFYYNKRFDSARYNPRWTVTTPYKPGYSPNLDAFDIYSTGANHTVYDAVGEDYALFFFVGCPQVYAQP